jgi:hypothetical protein
VVEYILNWLCKREDKREYIHVETMLIVPRGQSAGKPVPESKLCFDEARSRWVRIAFIVHPPSTVSSITDLSI